MKAGILGIAFLLLIVSSPTATKAVSLPEPMPAKTDHLMDKLDELNYERGQVLVEFKDRTKTAKKNQLKKQADVKKTIRKIGPPGEKDVYLFEVEPDQTINKAIKKFKASDEVVSATPNYIRRINFTPNDPLYGNQWFLNNTGQTIKGQTGTSSADIGAQDAWDITTGTSVPAAVIDSGIDLTHPDLVNNLWQNTDEIADNGIDDDGNGYIDDRNGYNFAGISQWNANVGWSFGRNNTNGAAQSIKGTGQPLTHIGLLLRKQGTPTSTIDISVRTSLGGADLATATISAGDASTSYREVYKALSTPVDLTDGQTFYIVFEPSAADSSNYYYIADNYASALGYEADPYKDGMEYWWNGSSWVSVAGDDFYFRTNPNAIPKDDSGHGTHVSGLIGAQGNNGVGVSGVSMGASMMALKSGDSAGWLTDSAIVEALYYAADNGAKVINMSFGGTSWSLSKQTAITYAYNSGATLFASSGNSGGTGMQYPAGYSNVIGVGATTNKDTKAGFSTYNSSVDVSAPGQYDYSTMPTYPVGLNSYGYVQSYDFMSGTSMASPVAAGVAALVCSLNPALTPAQVEQVLENNADDLGAAGRDDSFGYGRVNANQTLLNVTPVTGSISINSAASYTRSRAATLNLAAASTAGVVTNMRFKNDGGSWSSWAAYATTKSWTLTSGTGTKKVWVQYKDGLGSVSAPISDTIVLDATRPAASVRGPSYSSNVSRTKTFRVYWSINDPAPSSGAGSYDVQYKIEKDGGWRNWQTGTTNNSAEFTGRPGRTYYFRVKATDGVGNTGSFSGLKRVIVPYDNSTPIAKRRGFGHNFKKSGSRYYLGTVRYSTRGGDFVIYKFTGNRFAIISTKNTNRSMARIYVDGKYKGTVSTWASGPRYRQVIYSQVFKRIAPHRVKIVNVGNRRRLDLDALAVGR